MQVDAVQDLARECPLVALAMSRPKDHAVVIVPLEDYFRTDLMGREAVKVAHADGFRFVCMCGITRQGKVETVFFPGEFPKAILHTIEDKFAELVLERGVFGPIPEDLKN